MPPNVRGASWSTSAAGTRSKDANEAFAKTLSEFVQRIENGFADLALDLGLSREQLAGLRKWWRNQRSEAAAAARAEAARLPEFVEDPEFAR